MSVVRSCIQVLSVAVVNEAINVAASGCYGTNVRPPAALEFIHKDVSRVAPVTFTCREDNSVDLVNRHRLQSRGASGAGILPRATARRTLFRIDVPIVPRPGI